VLWRWFRTVSLHQGEPPATEPTAHAMALVEETP
jgi:hypothetical protein